jgi:hypothetical protein
VAIIAAILLVTSVRSQAASGWIDDRVPAAVGAVSPSVPSDLWATVGGGVGLLVHQGDVLIAKSVHVVVAGTAPETAPQTPPTGTPTGTRPDTTAPSAVPGVVGHQGQLRPQPHHARPPHHHAVPTTGATGTSAASATSRSHAARPGAGSSVHDRGKHLGWTRPGHPTHHPGGSQPATAAPAEVSGHPTARAHGHGSHGPGSHGPGNHGHGSHGDAPTNPTDVGPGNGHGLHHGWGGRQGLARHR